MKRLRHVTITGADDSVDPADLARIQEEFDFVEWGVLFSPKRRADARYPTDRWIRALILHDEFRRRAVAHLCGQYTRDVQAGTTRAFVDRPILLAFRRFQLNGFNDWVGDGLFGLKGHPFILQVRDEAQLQQAAILVQQIGAYDNSLLFDPSGGRGLEPFRWPRAPLGVRIGYAGGINPENVLQVLGDLAQVADEFSIDMESGVRTDDVFDLAKVREVLARVAEWRARVEKARSK